jgi:ATP/maltotriose-dependent transcriptional regulator MalT
MSDIIELQHKIEENRKRQIEQQQQLINDQQYRLRTAALGKEKQQEKDRLKQMRERKVVGLLDEGYNADQASYILDIPLSEVARIEEYNQKKRKFLMTGILDLPDQMVAISIFQ